MRWESLFADLQGQLEAEHRDEEESRIVDLAELEMGRTALADRLRGAVGRRVTLRLVDGTERAGEVVDAAEQWVLLQAAERRCVVPTGAVAAAWPLGGPAPRPGLVESRLGIAHVLRAIAREGATVRVRFAGTTVTGRITRVGADHLDCDSGDGARGGALTVALAAVVLVEPA